MRPLLEVEKLQVSLGGVPVIHDLSVSLAESETLGLVGESGSGKSTLARAILRLTPAASGAVRWRGENLLACSARDMRARRRDLQIVFQDPLASLDPRMRIADTLCEPLLIFEPALSGRQRLERVAEMLERVGLSPDMGGRRPHELSGGQCQRIAIARAMILRPRLLICDEPVSSLDVSIQGQIVNLLADLQHDTGTAMFFISHNLAVVRHLSHRVAVMYRGRLVEVGSRDAVFERPRHPYTRALLAAVPDLRRAALPTRSLLSVADVPRGEGSGCPYMGRCPFAAAVCASSVPPLENIDTQHSAACHRWRDLVYS